MINKLKPILTLAKENEDVKHHKLIDIELSKQILDNLQITPY